MEIEFDDNYPTCNETHVTLRIYSETKSPKEIEQILSVSPTDIQSKGEGKVKKNGWFFDTKKLVNSKDSRRHFHYLLGLIENKDTKFRELEKTCKVDIVCGWFSEDALGGGGPTMEPEHMKTLSRLGLKVWFDFYDTGSK